MLEETIDPSSLKTTIAENAYKSEENAFLTGSHALADKTKIIDFYISKSNLEK